MSDEIWMPRTPAGTALMDLAANTEMGAWANLRFATAHMPYKTVDDLKERGYLVEKVN